MTVVTPTPRTLLPPGVDEGGRIGRYMGAGGTALSFRAVEAEEDGPALVYLHGIESHGAWFLSTALGLRDLGISSYLVDRRGSGLNSGETHPADAVEGSVLIEDVRRFFDELGREAVLAGLSWGGKLALASAIAGHGIGIRGVVLVTPGLVPKVDLPVRDKLRLVIDMLVDAAGTGRSRRGLLKRLLGGRRRFDVPIETSMFSRTPVFADYIDKDPLRAKQVSGDLLRAGLELDRTIRKGVADLSLDVLLVLAEEDRIIDNDATLRVLGGLPSGHLRTRTYENADHSVQFDHHERLARDIAGFCREVYEC